MKARLLVSVLLVGLVASAIYVYAHWEPLTLWPSKRAAMLNSLKDPSSALVEGERLKGRYLCGTVNAKNSYGAYVGAARFVSFEEGYAISGLPLTSWPLSHEPTKVVFDLMEAKLRWLRTGIRPVDMTEEHALAFEDLWSRTCGDKAI